MPKVSRTTQGPADPNERSGPDIGIDEEDAAKHHCQRAFMPLVRRADGSVHLY